MRRTERRLVEDYLGVIDRTLPMLGRDATRAAEIVGLVAQVRGFEDVKLRNLANYEKAIAEALT
jgi:hypothetical protein